MRVDAKIIANDAVMGALEDDAITQLTNVACLPGVIEPVVGLPDMHWGL
jgi:tRNA-splicing ligase RtcB